jgi:hypothetical protein
MLLERLTRAGSLFIAYGTGPWTAMKKWIDMEGASTSDELAVVVDDTRSDGLSYRTTSEAKNGGLSELWPKFSEAALFGTVVSLAAEAWQSSAVTLGAQGGWWHSGSTLWGRLTRP